MCSTQSANPTSPTLHNLMSLNKPIRYSAVLAPASPRLLWAWPRTRNLRVLFRQRSDTETQSRTAWKQLMNNRCQGAGYLPDRFMCLIPNGKRMVVRRVGKRTEFELRGRPHSIPAEARLWDYFNAVLNSAQSHETGHVAFTWLRDGLFVRGTLTVVTFLSMSRCSLEFPCQNRDWLHFSWRLETVYKIWDYENTWRKHRINYGNCQRNTLACHSIFHPELVWMCW
jgi:hypothetical protein